MTGKKLGRPKKEIDFDTLEKLCELHCTRDEICDFLDIDDETLSCRLREQGYKNFSTYYEKHLGGGKVSLRRLQWLAAEKGSIPMLIWLGKQILGQSDRLDQNIKDITPPQLIPLIFEVNGSTTQSPTTIPDSKNKDN